MSSIFDVHHTIIGQENQEQFNTTTIAIIGLGGLGCHVAQILYRTGFNKLILIDDDLVQESNLPRQVLFHIKSIGQPKVESAKIELERFLKGNITCFKERLTSKNAKIHLSNVDIVMDCTDNFSSRYLISKTCKSLNIPMIYGGVDKFEIQIATFGYQDNLYFHEAFPDKQHLLQAEDCNSSGVLPHVVALAANYQVNEVINIICFQNPMVNELLCIHLKTGKQRVLKLNLTEDK